MENIWFIGLIVLLKRKTLLYATYVIIAHLHVSWLFFCVPCRQPPPASIFKLLAAVKNTIVAGVPLTQEIVYALIGNICEYHLLTY
jgi:hypothetical protein